MLFHFAAGSLINFNIKQSFLLFILFTSLVFAQEKSYDLYKTHEIITVDGDLVENSIDNCPNDLNPGQEDIDEDGIGDVCDPENIVTQLHEVRDNIFVNDSYSGVIVKSPDGKCWSIVVHNDGSMHTIKVKCP